MVDRTLVAIVDDDASIRRSLARLVSSLGLEAETFASAEELLEHGQAESCALLILDVRLPGMSGLELQRHLLARGCRAPIVFITAYAFPDTRRRALADGALAVLDKPYDHESLLRLLRQAVPRIDGR